MTKRQYAKRGFIISAAMTVIGFGLHFTAVSLMGRNGLFLSSSLGIAIGTVMNVVVNRWGA